MKTLLALLLIALPLLGQSRDLLFDRLEKLNSKDQTKCLEVAKRYIRHFPENASAYYFSSIIYDQKADKSKNSIGKYRNLKQAINYALSFEEKDDGTLAAEVRWSDFKAGLAKRAKSVALELDALNEHEYSSTLLSNLDQLDQSVQIHLDGITLMETPNETKVVKLSPITEDLKETEMAEINVNSKNQFFGMPKGTEIVKSASLTGEQDVLKLINAERAKLGMGALEWDENLANAARYHAYDLATQDYFDHKSYDRNGGKLVQVGGTFDRIKKFYSASFVNSENIAAGNSLPKSTYEQWFNSPGHYKNMFNPSSEKVGLGVFYDENSTYGYYWVFCTAL